MTAFGGSKRNILRMLMVLRCQWKNKVETRTHIHIIVFLLVIFTS